MKILMAVPAAVVLLGAAPAAGSLAGVASAEPGAIGPADSGPESGPPFVDHTAWVSEWSQWGDRPTLRVFPTPSGRLASGHPGTAAAGAWSEVVAMTPDADTAGMRAQFSCHWQFAETAEPGKTSWNLEPWRPVVDDAEMVASGCNPGGPEDLR